MKFFQLITMITFAGILFSACEKGINTKLDVTSNAGKANLKIIHASPYTINYSVQLKVNDERVSNNIINATPFPGGGLNTQGSNQPSYLAIEARNMKISLSVPKVGTFLDSISLYNTTINLERDKFYSAYITDTGANTQTVLITENVAEADAGFTRFKFVNLIPNVPAIDLYYGTDIVASNIAYKGSSPSFMLASGLRLLWSIRAAGALPTSTAIATYPPPTPVAPNMIIPNKRIMTVFSRGYNTGTGNKIPALSLLYN